MNRPGIGSRLRPFACGQAWQGLLTRWRAAGQAALMDPSASPPAGGDPVSMLLDGLEADDDLESVHRAIGDFFMLDRSASPRGLLELASSAFLACGASSADPVEFDELERHYLPEWPARGNAAHQKRRYALQAAILLSSGVEPEDTSWWRSNDLWSHAFDAVIVFVRAASERRQVPIAAICTALRSGD